MFLLEPFVWRQRQPSGDSRGSPPGTAAQRLHVPYPFPGETPTLKRTSNRGCLWPPAATHQTESLRSTESSLEAEAALLSTALGCWRSIRSRSGRRRRPRRSSALPGRRRCSRHSCSVPNTGHSPLRHSEYRPPDPRAVGSRHQNPALAQKECDTCDPALCLRPSTRPAIAAQVPCS